MLIETARSVSFQLVGTKECFLVPFESFTNVPFVIKRVFTVHTVLACHRGYHAHKQCKQLLICLQGTCVVTVDDSVNQIKVKLTKPNEGLYIPAGIWAEQQYTANSILMVLTDQLYDEADYIRNHAEFLQFRENLNV